MKNRFTNEELEERIYNTFFATAPDSLYTDENYNIFRKAGNYIKAGAQHVGNQVGGFLSGESAGNIKGKREVINHNLKADNIAANTKSGYDYNNQVEHIKGKNAVREGIYRAAAKTKEWQEGRANIEDARRLHRQGKIIGTAGGAAIGGGVGVAGGMLAGNAINKKTNEQIKALEAKPNLTYEERELLARLKQKAARTRKISMAVGGVAGAIGGGVGGYHLGKTRINRNKIDAKVKTAGKWHDEAVRKAKAGFKSYNQGNG